jgi:hypothetical protein
LEYVEVQIGGWVIDAHVSDWLEIWAQLTVPASKMLGYRQMIGQDPKNVVGQNTGLQGDVFVASVQLAQTNGILPSLPNASGVIAGRTIYIPLMFWFCRNIGLALPLVALQNSEVQIGIRFRGIDDMLLVYQGEAGADTWVTGDTSNLVSQSGLQAALWVDYVFLDTEERRRFAQVNHEYLIEQLQWNADTLVTPGTATVTVDACGNVITSGVSFLRPTYTQIPLNFSHPVKGLYFVLKGWEDQKQWSNFTDTGLALTPPFQTVGFDASAQTGNYVYGLAGLPTETDFLTYSDPSLSYGLSISLSSSNIPAGANGLNLQGDFSFPTLLSNGQYYFPATGDMLSFFGRYGTIYNPMTIYSTMQVQSTVNDLTNMQTAAAIPANTAFQSIVRITRTGNDISLLPMDASYAGLAATLTPDGLGDVYNINALAEYCNYDSVRPWNRLKTFYAGNPLATAQLRLNNYDREAVRDGLYFNRYQPHRYHTNIPASPGINVYSFCLHPEDLQPSGTCNFSRLTSAILYLGVNPMYQGLQVVSGRNYTCRIFALNYNILRIRQGMGAVAYTS